MQRPLRPLPAARRWCEARRQMFDLRELERAHAVVGTRGAADAGACVAAAGAAARHACRRQAREPHADRRLQGARRAGLCRSPEARTADTRRESSRRRRGNHGQSLAFAARRHGVPVTIYVPHGNSVEKNRAMRAFGADWSSMARISSPPARRPIAARERDGLEIVPSFHPDLVLGVATYALELLRTAPDLDVLYVPIGQGSGICGCILARDLLGPEDGDRRRAVDRSAVLALSFAAGSCHEQRGHAQTAVPTRFLVVTTRPAANDSAKDGASVDCTPTISVFRPEQIARHDAAADAGALPDRDVEHVETGAVAEQLERIGRHAEHEVGVERRHHVQAVDCARRTASSRAAWKSSPCSISSAPKARIAAFFSTELPSRHDRSSPARRDGARQRRGLWP